MDLFICTYCDVSLRDEYHAREHLKYHSRRLGTLEREIQELESTLNKKTVWHKELKQADKVLYDWIKLYWGDKE